MIRFRPVSPAIRQQSAYREIGSELCCGPRRITLVLSEARFHKSVKSGEVLCARSIEPFEGGRWRLRRMRASGCTDLTAMGIESFFVCSLLILLGLGKSEKTENRS